MKKALITLLSTFVLAGFSQEEKTLRLGLQIGPQANHSRFSGGMSDANARFQHNAFGSGSFNIVGRYDFNKRWMLSSGLGFSSLGFDYAIAENYSLLDRARNQKQFTRVRSSFGMVEIPLMAFYKFNPNCKNVRWLAGAGFAQTFTGSQTAEGSASKANDGTSNVNYINASSKSAGSNYLFLRWSVGREKMYKNGGILNLSFLVNMGFRSIAQSTVNYTIDNQNYTHSFTNNGNFAGLRLSYFFKPLHVAQPGVKKPAVTK